MQGVCSIQAIHSFTIQTEETSVEGHAMRSLAAGRGPAPLVLLHGLLGAARCWLGPMQTLASRTRVHAVDALGIGESARVPGIDASLGAGAHRLRLWLDGRGLERVDLLGTSHGGAVAMWFAAHYPERVRSLVLHAPANPFCIQSRPQIRFAATRLGHAVAHWIPSGPRRLHMAALSRMYGNPALVQAASLEAYVQSLRQPGTVDYVLSVLRSWTADMAALAPLLPRLRKLPVLLLWGDRDRAVSHTSVERLSHVLRAPLEILPGLGHLPFEEAPQLFAERVGAFLRKIDAGAARTA